jgi:hypothetical protein
MEIGRMFGIGRRQVLINGYARWHVIPPAAVKVILIAWK